MDMDMEILLMLQEFRNGMGGAFRSFFYGMTYLGSSHTLILMMAVIFWSIDKDFGTYLFMGWNGNRLLNGFLKITACVYRPWIREPRIVPDRVAKITATGYSFPSGHSMNAASFFGGLFFCSSLKKLLPRICSVMILLLVMFSRVYFGVHTPGDVLTGGLFGVLFMYGMKRFYLYLEKHPETDGLVLLGAFVLSAVLGIYAWMKPYPEDFDAFGRLIVPGSGMAKDMLRAVWGNLAFFTSWFMERRWICFSVCKGKKERGISAALGLFGYFLLERLLFPVLKMTFGGTAWMIISAFLQMMYIVCVVPILIQILFQRKEVSKKWET